MQHTPPAGGPVVFSALMAEEGLKPNQGQSEKEEGKGELHAAPLLPRGTARKVSQGLAQAARSSSSMAQQQQLQQDGAWAPSARDSCAPEQVALHATGTEEDDLSWPVLFESEEEEAIEGKSLGERMQAGTTSSHSSTPPDENEERQKRSHQQHDAASDPAVTPQASFARSSGPLQDGRVRRSIAAQPEEVLARQRRSSQQPDAASAPAAVPQASSARSSGPLQEGSHTHSSSKQSASSAPQSSVMGVLVPSERGPSTLTPVSRQPADAHSRASQRHVSRSRSRPRARPDELRDPLRTQDPSERVQVVAGSTPDTTRAVRGHRAQVFEADLPPGNIHGSHVVHETQRFIFCAVCGTYGRYLKRTQLHLVCPRNRWAQYAVEDLMRGLEPGGINTNSQVYHFRPTKCTHETFLILMHVCALAV